MMTSSNGNIFRVTCFCTGNSQVPGDFPAQRPVTRSFDVFVDLRPNKRLSKQSWGWWFEMLSCSLWRHCNEHIVAQTKLPLFFRRHFKLHSLDPNIWIFIKMSLKFCPEDPINNISALDQSKAIIWINDALVQGRIYASFGLNDSQARQPKDWIYLSPTKSNNCLRNLKRVRYLCHLCHRFHFFWIIHLLQFRMDGISHSSCVFSTWDGLLCNSIRQLATPITLGSPLAANLIICSV